MCINMFICCVLRNTNTAKQDQLKKDDMHLSFEFLIHSLSKICINVGINVSTLQLVQWLLNFVVMTWSLW